MADPTYNKPSNKSPDKNSHEESFWYTAEPSSINEACRKLLEMYSGVPAEDIVQHVVEVRNQAYEIYPYPCLGQFRFLQIQTPTLPIYPDILSRIRSGAQFLDLGCCVGQELRQLAYDGAPAENLHGTDLRQAFIDAGYALFKDRDSFKGQLFAADALAADSALLRLKGKMSIINANSFFHLFAWEQQVQIAKLVIQLFDGRGDNLLIGRQIGREEKGGQFAVNEQIATAYAHSPETWERLWNEVGELTGTQWSVESRLVVDESRVQAQSEGVFWLYFVIRRKV